MIQVFLSHSIGLPVGNDTVTDGGEQHLHDQLGHGSGQCTGGALKNGPVEAVPEDGGKAHKDNEGKQEIIKELNNEDPELELEL